MSGWFLIMWVAASPTHQVDRLPFVFLSREMCEVEAIKIRVSLPGYYERHECQQRLTPTRHSLMVVK